MDTLIQQIVDIITNVRDESVEIKELAAQIPTTVSTPIFQYRGKIVLNDTTVNKIIRIEQIYDILLRTTLRYKAMEVGIQDIFLEETITLQNDQFGVTEQEIITEWGGDYPEECIPEKILYGNNIPLSAMMNYCYPDLYDTIYEFFETYHIRGIHSKNAGLDPDTNKIKVFDWYGEYSIDNNGRIIPPGSDE